MAVMVGGSLTAVTVSVKLVGVLSVPSLTVTVMVAVPLSPDTGVTVTFLDSLLPPKAIFATGTSVAFEDAPVSVNALVAVSSSPIVKGMAGVAVLSGVV